MVGDFDNRIDTAAGHFLSGALPETEAICQEVIRNNPDHPKALHLLGLVRFQSGDEAEALSFLERAVDAAPGDPVPLNSLGSLLYQQDLFAEAEDAFRRAVAAAPNLVEPHVNLGNALFALRRLPEALSAFKAALTLAPDNPSALNNAGTTLRDLGRLAEAETLFRRALALSPGYLEPRYNLGDLLFNQMRLEEAEDCFRRVAEAAPDFLPAWVGLGQALYNLNRLPDATEALERARSLSADHPAVSYAWRLVNAGAVPPWHIPMINNEERTDAYRKALENAVKPGDVVLDIGAGSALVAMLAVRAGAAHVYACEGNAALALAAEETVARNGFGDRITVIRKSSTRLAVGVDLPRPADVLVSELITSGLVAPGMLTTLRHALSNLVKSGAPIIPAAATVHAQLVDCGELARINPVRTIAGFDLSAFDRFRAPGYAKIDLAADPHTALSDPFRALDFDFTADLPDQGRTEVNVAITKVGTFHGVAFWFDLVMDGSVTYSSANRSRRNHWKQAVHFLPHPIPVSPGTILSIAARYDNTRVWFEVEG